MFLLIPIVIRPSSAQSFHFKFHYVSINSDAIKSRNYISSGFKFHYVSINSTTKDYVEAIRNAFKFHYVSINSKFIHNSSGKKGTALNSIMFLLIHAASSGILSEQYTFKFHYVSINSPKGYFYKVTSGNFKFHYVSINSLRSLCKRFCISALNSIMFLLIHHLVVYKCCSL